MPDYRVRPCRPEDTPALIVLWRGVFGDSEALLRRFFRLLPAMGCGVAAEGEQGVFGMAYLLDGLWLREPDGTEKRCGYLYAVAVDPARRGTGAGAALSRAAFALGRERGAEILCTQPADTSLFGWYGRVLGTELALRRRRETVPAAPGAAVRPNAGDYGRRRELLLSGTRHLRLSGESLAFQRALCVDGGGELYDLGEGIAAAYVEDGRARIPELLAPPGADRRALAAALAAHLGAAEAELFSSDPAGEPYLAALPGTLPADTVWGLSFD